ncbi:MAG TPA: Mur ligase family protein [Gemmatimonadales bacterium]|nr:Mur ligase family protein [Gemmatimonadales bacterium]
MSGDIEARRITGPHLLGDRTGAALDVPLGDDAEERIAAWEQEAARLLAAVRWGRETTAVGRFAGGAHLFVSAPIDSLYAATELAELAWRRGTGSAAGVEEVERLRDQVERARKPALVALEREATRRGLTFLHDDDGVSIGSGRGAQRWPGDALPSAVSVDWSRLSDVPIALVTGSNGKTSTVRLAAAMAREAGHTPGYTTTDGVSVGKELVLPTDFAGPMGARVALRDTRITLAILETARGGILRRGLAVRRADAAVITNIAEDHFGDFGVGSLEELLDAKLVVTRVVPDGGSVILNADDALLRARGDAMERVTWFSRGGRVPMAKRQVILEGDEIVRYDADRAVIASLGDVRSATAAAAPHEIENVLAAAAVALALGVPAEAIAPALRRFDPLTDNPGRGTMLELDGIRIVVDYGHNPHGFAALGRLLESVPAQRRLLLLGQAGDREDAAIAQLAASALELRPDQIVLKELASFRRGRAPGEVPALLRAALLSHGFAADAIDQADTELEAVEQALAWARPGDLLVLLIHDERERVLERLRQSGATAAAGAKS